MNLENSKIHKIKDVVLDLNLGDDDLSGISAIVKKAKIHDNKEDVKKQIKSKNIKLKDKISLITENVHKVLGSQINNVIVIKTKEQFDDYITKAIDNGVIAIDTETNNSLEPITCKLMGLCLYSPNLKQAYIPVNHVDIDTNNKLEWQLTEEDCRQELKRLKDANTFIVMHNGKFDFEVIKCTCGIDILPNWDTLIASKLINENESAGLKFQYTAHIDTNQEKYDIEGLFEHLQYEIFPPEVFALYAATDSLMTYRLYEYQKKIMESPSYDKIYNVMFKKVEMPCVEVVANMELNGVDFDFDYSKRLSDKYHNLLNSVDEKIARELSLLKDKIVEWRLSIDANIKPLKKGKQALVIDGNNKYEYSVNKNGSYSWKKIVGNERMTLSTTEVHNYGLDELLGKSKSEQLEDNINLGSPSQLAILLYDVLLCPPPDPATPRGTGEECLEKIDLPLCKLILKRRGIVKLLSGYIDVLPEISKASPDGRIRTHFNQYGAATGRFSSSTPVNLQNIPSHNKEIRMMFRAKTDNNDIEINDNYYEVSDVSEVLTTDGWKRVKDVKVGDIICGDDTKDKVSEIVIKGDTYLLYV